MSVPTLTLVPMVVEETNRGERAYDIYSRWAPLTSVMRASGHSRLLQFVRSSTGGFFDRQLLFLAVFFCKGTCRKYFQHYLGWTTQLHAKGFHDYRTIDENRIS